MAISQLCRDISAATSELIGERCQGMHCQQSLHCGEPFVQKEENL